MPELKTTLCNRDCPDTCGIIATVEDGRVTRLGGDPAHPVTRGFLCHRTNQFLKLQYSPERLTAPLLRKGGELVEVGWDEALDYAAAELVRIRDESGPAAILDYRSGGSLGMLKSLTSYFFSLFGPVTVKRGDICSGAGEAAQRLDFGVSDSGSIFQLLEAKSILLWGKNVVVSSPHLVPILREAKARGAKLTLVDPVFHKTASLCDAFIQPRPGGDFALAMGVARVLFERGWVDAEAEGYCDHLPEFRALALSRTLESWCADADVTAGEAAGVAEALGRDAPCTILVGWGMGRRDNGGAMVRALDALGAVSGNLGVEGGGVSFYFQRRGAFDTVKRRPPPRTLCEPRLGPEILAASDPPIRAVWVTCGNPVAMLPESRTTAEALSTRDFVAVVDSFLTDTARAAHLVLPTTTLLEADDLLGAYGHQMLGVSRPVVPPPAGVKSDLEIIQALAERVGLGAELAGDARSWKQRMVSGKLAERGVNLEQLEAGPVENPLAARVLFEGRRFLTATGRVNLIHEAPRPAPPRPADFPLLLTSVSTLRSQSSQWYEPPGAPLTLTVHPDAATGFSEGDLCFVESALGRLQVRLCFDARQRRDVALLPKGGHLHRGTAANALTRARLTDLGEGGALYEEPVRLAKN